MIQEKPILAPFVLINTPPCLLDAEEKLKEKDNSELTIQFSRCSCLEPCHCPCPCQCMCPCPRPR